MHASSASELEQVRQTTLAALELLDTPGEERFDRLTRLAARLFDVPMAAISLIDRERQWFKSGVGIPVAETSREASFCAHAIAGDALLHVEDAALDERFASNPYVMGAPGIRFYAGRPLSAPDWYRVGTLCVMDVRPRKLSTDERVVLHELGRFAERELIRMSGPTIDMMTGLSNWAGFQMLAGPAIRLCEQVGRQAVVLVLRLTSYERIHQEFGPDEAACAMWGFVDALKAVFGQSDVLARTGPETFSVLITGGAVDTALVCLRRLGYLVAGYNARISSAFGVEYEPGIAAYEGGVAPAIEMLVNEAEDRIGACARLTHVLA